MPVIDGITIDVEWWTNQDSESDPRNMAMDTLQPHHCASTSLNGSRALMDAGGRTVSSNGLLDIDGTLYGVVLPGRRAYTSASSFDHRSFTVEMVNSSGAPGWGLTDAQHRRLGQIAREIAALRNRTPGLDMIVPHYRVPGTYATACPGPSYDQNKVLEYALGGTTQEEEDMIDLTIVTFEKGPDNGGDFASQGVITPITGFVRTSFGRGPRGATEGWKAIADELGFKVVEKGVDANGWILAQLFKPQVGGGRIEDDKQFWAAVEAAVSKGFSPVTTKLTELSAGDAKILDAVKALNAGGGSVDMAAVKALIDGIPAAVRADLKARL